MRPIISAHKFSAFLNQGKQKMNKFVSGYGQHHTNDADPANPNKKLQPYLEINLDGIRALVDNPQKVDKIQARWVIPSTLKSRNFKDQQANGNYWMLWADFDENPKPLKQLNDYISAFNFDYEIYSSRSATLDKQKGRVLIPLDKPLSGDDWIICQKLLNDAFNNIGFNTDRASERSAQLCYLPNAGKFYESYSSRNGIYFDVTQTWAVNIKAHKDELLKQEKALEELMLARAARKSALKITDTPDLIGAFNSCFTVQEILLKAGYAQRGDTFRHPNSDSGSYSASVKDERVHALSSNDPLYNNSKGAHDAFSAFTVLIANGDHNTALKLAGDEWLLIGGVPYNQAKRAENLANAATHGLTAIDTASFSLKKFSLNGRSADMKKQMLSDTFILGRLAILGQSTVFYAPPNAGKTLLTLWLLIEAIKSGSLNASNVYYINADDNFKGLVVKLEISEQWGFEMLAPNFNDFNAQDFTMYIKTIIGNDTAKGVVVILDTVKKFTDIMDKRMSSDFGKIMREFVLKGGSVIMLAHVNKHRNAEGKPIAAGTSDLTDDADCAYILDPTIAPDGKVTVIFENKKSRGDVDAIAAFSYSKQAGKEYLDLLNSVQAVNQDEANAAKSIIEIQKSLQDNADAIEAIANVIRSGTNTRTEIIKEANTSSTCSRSVIKEVLIRHTGTNYHDGFRWKLTHGGIHNAHKYSLISMFDETHPHTET